jgi:glycosyltransferase involved in cell wall biosynthesis
MVQRLDNISILLIAGTLGQGGAEKQLFLLAKSLYNSNYRIIVISLTKDEFWEKELIKIGIEVKNIPRMSRFKKFLAIHKLVKRIKPNIVYSFHFYTSFYAGLLRLFHKNLLTIGSIRNDGISEISANGNWSWLHMHSCHKIISNNIFGKLMICEKLKISTDKISILNNAFEFKNHSYQFSNRDKLRAAFVGRLVDSKDPLMLVDIWKRNHTLGMDIHLDIIGDGILKGKIQNAISENKLESCINLLGIKENASCILNQYNFLISTSHHEGTPNVVLEALANECLVVSRNYAGIGDILLSVHENYKMLTFETVEEASEIIQDLIQNPSKYEHLRGLGRNWVIENYSLQKQYNTFLEIAKC